MGIVGSGWTTACSNHFEQIVISTRHNCTGLVVFVIIFLQVVGEYADTIFDAFESGMRVSHGHAEIGVAHGLLDDRDGSVCAS